MLSGVALLVSIFFSLLFTNNVMAKMTTDTAPSSRAASYSYWKATSKCVSDHMHANIDTKVGENGATAPSQGDGNDAWFDNRDAWVSVYPDGKQDCAQVMAKALKLWGWTSSTQFLRDIGYTFDSNVPGWVQANNSNDGQKRFDGFKSAVLSKVGNIVDLLDNSAKYVLYTGMFNSKSKNLSECSAKQVGKLSEVDVTQRDAANNNESRGGVTYTTIKVVEGSTSTNYVYTYTPVGESTLTAYASAWNYRGSNYPGGTGEHFSCEDLVSKINANANAFAFWNSSHASTPDDLTIVTGGTVDDCLTTDTCGDPVSSCSIEGLGWILCPAINFLALVADQSFNFLSDNFLRTDPKVFSTDNETYKTWAIVRNIANILFVIAFLIIVFSQLTGVGISNYGVKKMLPRIVVAAILVNVSYFISQLAIDFSNILGYSIRGVFDSVIASVSAASSGGEAGSMSWLKGGENGFVDLAGGIIGGTLAISAVYLMLSAFGPILLAAVLALLLILFILVARQAIIILLVVLSPLAFVAFLLPNTEQYFKQWRKILTAMLMLFPIIALVYGASELAANLLGRSFSGVGGADNNMFGQIISAAVLILPLFAVPILLKKSLDAVPMAGQMANKWASKGFGGVGSKLKEGGRNSYVGKGRAIRKQQRQVFSDRKFAENVSKGRIQGLAAKGIAVTEKGRYARNAVGRIADEASEKALESDISAAAVSMRSTHNDPDHQIDNVAKELTSAISIGDIVKARAAQSILLNSGGAGLDTLERTLEASSDGKLNADGTRSGGDPEMRNSKVGVSLRTALNSAGLKAKNNTVATWAYSDHSFASIAGGTARDNVMNPDGTVSMGSDGKPEQKKVSAVLGLSSVELAGQRGSVIAAAAATGEITQAQAQGVLESNVSKDMDLKKKEIFERIANQTPPTSQATGVPGAPTPTSGGSTSAPVPTTNRSSNSVPIDPEWQDWHREQQTDKTVITVDHTGSNNVAVPPQPQSARESQEQAKAAVIARARQQAASAGQQGSHSTDSSGFQTPPTASEDYQKKMSE